LGMIYLLWRIFSKRWHLNFCSNWDFFVFYRVHSVAGVPQLAWPKIHGVESTILP
jgi:hypothetical protein